MFKIAAAVFALCALVAFVSAESMPLVKVNPIAPKPADGTLCLICEYVIQWSESELEANATETDVEAVLDKVCDFIPVYGSECADFVNAYIPYLINALVNYATPDVVCVEIGVCAASTGSSDIPEPAQL